MGSYHPLVSIAVEHMFYSPAPCRGLKFVPTSDTSITINKIGLLTRNTSNGISVFYDEHTTGILQGYVDDSDDPLILTFKVFSKNPLFENFTERPIHQKNAILYFDNRGMKTQTSGKQRLHDEEYVSSINFKNMDAPWLENILDIKDRHLRPIFIVRLFMSKYYNNLLDKHLNVISRKYYLKFKSRKTFWKYYMLGLMAQKNSYIADLNEAIKFEFTGKEILSDNRTALTFRSEKPIPMRDTFSYRFQLKESGARGEKVLIRRLPMASENQINREIIEGKEAVVSEIYINY